MLRCRTLSRAAVSPLWCLVPDLRSCKPLSNNKKRSRYGDDDSDDEQAAITAEDSDVDVFSQPAPRDAETQLYHDASYVSLCAAVL